MNGIEDRLARCAIALAAQAALLAMTGAPIAASAQEDDVNALTLPTSYIRLGLMDASGANPKFGEYNGLYRSGGYGVLDFDLRGGDASGMRSGTQRWQVFGRDLGTNAREIGASFADQGRWRVALSFDQLRHYTTAGDFDTPYVGAMGGNSFTLPANFGVINTTTSSNSGTGVLTSASKGAQTLTDNQLGDFHRENVYSQRATTAFNASYAFDRQWSVALDLGHLEQTGAKLISSGTDAFNLSGSGGFNYGGERIAMLMNPTHFTTDHYKLALNWFGERGNASASYLVSNFSDAYHGLSWSNPWVSGGTGAAPNPATGTLPTGGFPVDTMATPPSNSFQQLDLRGGYAFGPATRLAGGLSYARNTQNQSYDGSYTITPETVPGLPVNSLGGHVDTTHADFKLTQGWGAHFVSYAGLKFNQRNNHTASNTYTFLDLGGEAQTAVNTPMSHRRILGEIAGDAHFGAGQHLHAGYEYEQIKRWCGNDLANNAQGSLSSTNAGYYTTASCVQVPRNTENRLTLVYRARPADNLDLNAGYVYGRRKSEVNSSFYNPMQANSEGFENYGYLAFFDAARTQDAFKAGLNWQATSGLSLGLNGRTTRDRYDSTFGVQNGKSSSANLDASYAASETSSIAAYLSWQQRSRDLLTANGRNAVAPLTNLWTNSLDDVADTFGVGAKQSGLLHGKLALTESLSVSLSRTHYSTAVLYALTGSSAIGTLSYGDTPEIKSDLAQFRIGAEYTLNRASQIVVAYQFQRLKADDYLYNAYAYGYNPTSMLPSNQQAPNYRVNAIMVAYRYSFR